MASFGNQLSFFFLLVLVISPQIQAREGNLFSLFSHFRTIYNVKDPLDKTNAESPALAPEPALPPGPTPEPASTPELQPQTAPTPAPSAEQEIGSTIPSGPAPEPEFFDSGKGYGLYGRGTYSQYPPTMETLPPPQPLKISFSMKTSMMTATKLAILNGEICLYSEEESN